MGGVSPPWSFEKAQNISPEIYSLLEFPSILQQKLFYEIVINLFMFKELFLRSAIRKCHLKQAGLFSVLPEWKVLFHSLISVGSLWLDRR